MALGGDGWFHNHWFHNGYWHTNWWAEVGGAVAATFNVILGRAKHIIKNMGSIRIGSIRG